jgi:hypothetical protein
VKKVDNETITVRNLNRPGRASFHLNFLKRRLKFLGIMLLILFVAWGVWSWGFCRFYVRPGQMAVITAKSGDPLLPGQILARAGQKGVLEEVLGEGRHIWNPIFYDWQIVDAVFIPPGKVGVVTSLVGEDLPPGEFLANPGQKGTWRKTLGPGRYRLNPFGHAVEIVDAVSVPVGFAGVVTNLSGTAAKEGAFAAPGEKGVRSDVLQPGIYYVNPREYQVAAVEVGVNQVSLQGQSGGMVLTKNMVMDENNQLIQRLNQNVLEEQRRRRDMYQQQDSVQAPSSSYPVSPAPAGGPSEKRGRGAASSSADGMMAEAMDDPGAPARKMLSRSLPTRTSEPATIAGRVPGMSRVDVPPAFILDQFVNFPSRDGFDISLDMTVEFELRPEHLAPIYRDYGDLPAVVEKILMPQVLSVSRLKGSAYRAVDFIAGEGREIFQNDLTAALQDSLREKRMLIHSALIRNVNVPSQILDPLRAASLSRETDLTNKEKQNTARKQAELNREMSLIRQSGEQVMQETDKLKAEIAAEMRKTVAMIQGDTTRRLAVIERETAQVKAEKTIALGRADADAIRLVGEEKAKGFGMKVQAFGRDGGEYALYEFAVQLNPDMKINLLHAGEGTLWTDLKNASLAEMGGARILQNSNR